VDNKPVNDVSSQLSVLLIEDNDEHATIISRYLRQIEDTRIAVSRASRLAEGLAQLTANKFDALLLDLQLPDSPIEHTLSRTLAHASEVPIIVISTVEERALAKKALKEGAQDYLCKADVSSDLLNRAIDHAIERQHIEKRIREEAFRKQALFVLSQHALTEKNASYLLDRAASILSDALHVDFVKILEFLPEEHSFLLRAGIGWKEHFVGREKIGAELSSLAGFTLRASRPTIPGNLRTLEPVIIEDLTTETRFSPAQFLRDHGVRSGISVLIHGKDEDHPYGVLGAHTVRKRRFSADEAQFLQAAANILAAALLRLQLEEELRRFSSDLQHLNADLERRVARRTNELEQSEARLRALATELNLTEQRERKRLATELHDHLVQMLALARLKLGQAKRIPLLEAQCADLLSQTDEVLSQSLSYARTLIANLSPSVLYEFGLPMAMRWLAEQMQRYDLMVQAEMPEQVPMALPEEQAVLLFQSVRELLMNSAKHSKSSQAKLLLEYQQEALRVEVRDYGVGFNVATLAGAPSSPKFGLFSIRERMKTLGGAFALHSQPGEGTTAVITVPIPREVMRPTRDLQDTMLRAEDSRGDLFQAGTNNIKVPVLLVDDHAMVRQGY
jgi:signal transduction histidine kinase/DNA-binding NarL/FixJ family response regulator